MESIFKIDENLNTSTPMWRYLKFNRFEDLIRKREIYFSRWDKLGDRFEGSYPDDYSKQKKGGWGRTPWGRGGWGAPFYILKRFSESERNLMYICCFCNKDHESTLMWDKYSEPRNGVAIKTTIERLLRSFSDSLTNEIAINGVKYLDFEKESFNQDLDIFSLFSLKRIEFAEEREERMILKNDPPIHGFSENGGSLKIDPAVLIEEIVLYPEPESEGKEGSDLTLVKDLLTSHNLNIKVRESNLSRKPNF